MNLSPDAALYMPMPVQRENPAYLSEQLITYLGNKRKLLNFIGAGVGVVKQKLGKDKLSCLDLFSGSGIVARYLKQHSSLLIVNDLEAYSKVINT
ncbi:MAG: DNA adenine methylase, partial [Candidatus Cloacimonetes bacterium]|nr:DNA adenine methylase [Candidatus Cloacimonadota bacterium]